MVKLKRNIIFFLFLFIQSSFGSIRSISEVNLELRKNQIELDSHQKNLDNLKKQILSIRNNVSGETNKFSKIISIKTNLKAEIDAQKNELNNEKKVLENEIIILRKIFAGLILTEDSEQEIDYRYLTLKNMKDRESKLKSKKTNINSMIEKIEKLEKELQEYDFIESDLISNIEKMHQKEKSLTIEVEELNINIQKANEEIDSLGNTKNKLLHEKNEEKRKREFARIEKIKNEKKETEIAATKVDIKSPESNPANAAENTSLSFSLPLKEYERIQKDKAGGISLFVNSGRDIISPEKGEVLYTGKLSTYGNVIVIKHSEGYQSVILGNLISNVSKSDSVEKNQVIGRIIENSGNEKKLYYELRNKDKKVAYNKLLNDISI